MDYQRGGKRGMLGDVLKLIYGKALRANTRIEGIYPVVGSNGIVDYHNEYLVNGPGIVIGRKGTIGEVLWIDDNFFPIDTTFYIKDLLGVPDLYYHFFILKQQDFKKIGSDSAVPGLNCNQAMTYTLNIPSLSIIIEYNKIVKPFFDQQKMIKNEISTLVNIRDSLLPKLISGKVRVEK